MDLKYKVALVTGGGTGIGRATSLELAKRGANVAVNYSRSKADADETVQLINSHGGNAIAIQADVSHDTEIREMVEHIVQQFGTIDLLVNNASITSHIALDDLEAVTDAVWDNLFDVNVKGMFNCARAVAPYMKTSNQGAIVNLGSIAGITGLGSSLPYAVSKAAVHALTKSLARALAPDIRVNCVVPGAVATRWWAGREEQMKRLAPHLLLQHISTPEDIAKFICSVLEQEAMTGQIITIDSGQTL
ncbi:SDR family NAD(P)-dependent oxidoreductase [Paenibacillus macquariensis]|uniref:3-oxoacyl-[acyl-carrier protein] reductase n=1 Tax=Paenibacillus macquariensis TaxID=948756 RepID=A0ABY1JJE5_9BACL|nr:SDR family NAD(P)-dependent oxidoreductase [Paenibacillus macquariensis]MEC0089711.1 SDR family NAD(P)-dependent oxidoreductase [Paenibacillus macquariensis]OAB30810.1 3-ketoacyl-ACP reductase [Paenibacillus macquariensis subsp. macquariensis]SIQ29361.1 3-oxoacyl-[acyl-carrier protein] reductase [Paenibacillus macquariensis]